MPRRHGEFTDLDLDEAWGALHSAESVEALRDRIEAMPVLRSPLFHAMYRNWYMQSGVSRDPDRSDQVLRFDSFFTLLHYRQFEALRARPPSEPVAEVPPYAPPYFEAVLRLLDGRLPDHGGPSLDPTDGGSVSRALSAILGRRVEAPRYEPSTGSVWGLLVVACPGCGTTFLACRARLVSLVEAPELVGPMRAGRINATRCPGCGGGFVEPRGSWLQEQPEPRDPLAALSCYWALSASSSCYQPVPGTRRDPEYDRVLEVRFMQLGEDFQVDKRLEALAGPEEGGRVRTMAVAYTFEELLGIYERANAAPTPEDSGPEVLETSDLPFAMEVMIEDTTRKVAHGFAPLGGTIQLLRQILSQVAKDWPIVPATQAEAGGREGAIRAVIMNVIAEECAKARGLGPDVRAMLAGTTVQSLVALNELGLAEVALAEAVELAEQVPESANRSSLRMVLLLIRAEVAQALGRAEESYRLREESRRLRLGLEGKYDQEIHLLQEESSRALLAGATGRIREAVETFPRCLAGYEALVGRLAAEAPDDEDRDRRAERFAAEYSLSGAYSNWANLLLDLARHREGEAVNIQDGTAFGKVRGETVSSSDSPALREELDAALRALEAALPACDTSEAIREHAREYYERAMAISTRIGGWEFAGIQAGNLANLLEQLGRPEEAKRHFELSLEYAGRASDHERMIWSHHALARLDLAGGDGPSALGHLGAAAREAMHLAAGAGRRVGELAGLLGQTARAAVEVVPSGGDPTTAFLIAETLKAFPTALALKNAAPGGGRLEPTVGAALEGLIRRREALRLRAIWEADGLAELVEQLAEVEGQIEEIEWEARLRNPEYLRWCDAAGLEVTRPGDLLRALEQVGPGAMLLGLLPTRDGLWSYLIGADGTTHGRAPWPDRDAMDFETLAGMILRPHAERLVAADPSARLLFSPGDEFATLPLAGFRLEGTPLCERLTTVYVQSGEVLEATLGRPARRIESIACLGDPNRPDARPLPGARAEAELVAGLFRERGLASELRVREAATLTALKELASTSDALHLACHAARDLAPQHLARLLLAPDLRRGDSGDLTDGRVLAELAPRRGGLVNLAACSSGADGTNLGQLPRGFVGAFLYAGAGAVLASLWPLGDRAAAIFQATFYAHLLDGHGPADGLAATQRLCVAGSLGPEMQAFDAWAGYVVYGTA